MPFSEYKWGYCRNCVKNVPHNEWHRSALFRFLDQMTFGKLRLLRIGPWHCIHCHVESVYLRPTLADAVDYSIPEPVSDFDVTDTDRAKTGESVGNFIREDESLVTRSNRLRRFSEKYRDSIVRRILKGPTTMAQVRQEMDVSESELIAWFADLFDRQQARLEAIESAVENLPTLKIVDDGSNPTRRDGSVSGSFTVEGQVRPR